MKAVLVIDTPNDCDECPLVSAINDMCILLNEDAFPNRWVEDAPYYSLKEKGDCPLRPLPERLPEVSGNIRYFGWNACLDAITGDEE